MRTKLLCVALLIPCLAFGCSSAADEPDGEDQVSADTAASGAARTRDFVDPRLSDDEIAAVLQTYAHVDPNHVIADNLRRDALVYFDVNKTHIENQDNLAIVDFSLSSGKKRFYLVDMASGHVTQHMVAHGAGSEDGNGFAKHFSDVDGSHQSSLGFILTGEIYTGVHGRSLRLDGLSKTDAHLRPRAIVIHGAAYVHESASRQGNSFGCFALDMDIKDDVITALHGGALMYSGLGK
jgi:hypothetical protein